MIKLKPITASRYNKKMDKIIALKLPVHETLIQLLEEASKYKIKNDTRKRTKRSSSSKQKVC